MYRCVHACEYIPMLNMDACRLTCMQLCVFMHIFICLPPVLARTGGLEHPSCPTAATGINWALPVSHPEMNSIPAKCKTVHSLSSSCFCFYFFINHLPFTCGRRF